MPPPSTTPTPPAQHSRVHAADVVRNLYCLLTHGGVARSALGDHMDASIMAGLLAAVVHDFEHRVRAWGRG